MGALIYSFVGLDRLARCHVNCCYWSGLSAAISQLIFDIESEGSFHRFASNDKKLPRFHITIFCGGAELCRVRFHSGDVGILNFIAVASV